MTGRVRDALLIPLFAVVLGLVLPRYATAQQLPPNLKTRDGRTIPTNMGLPPGMSAAQVQQMLRKLEQNQPALAAAEEEQPDDAEELVEESAEEKEEQQSLLEQEEEEIRQRNQELFLQHVESMVADGELGEEEERFLEIRGTDLGIDPEEAQQEIQAALGRQEHLERYRAYLEGFIDDGVIDRTEGALLRDKRDLLGISEEAHHQELQRVRRQAEGRPRDTLADIRQTAPPFADPPLERFGKHLFQLGPETFEPPSGLPPPDTYVVGVGDQFQVSLWGRMEAEYQLVVDGEGNVLFPQIGPIRLAGLAYAEARQVLKRRAEAITGVSAAAILLRMRPVQVFVVGEAAVPGAVTLAPSSTVVHAVLAAGGPTDIGAVRSVRLRRGGRELAALDLYDFLRSGEVAGDRPLQTGDVVVIPRAERLVSVSGKVRRPAIYALKSGEGLRDLIEEFAGGLAADAFGGRVQVSRSVGNRSRVILDVRYREDDTDFPLEDGDAVRVFPLKAEVDNRVTLYGHVHQPGHYAFSEGMRIADLLRSREDLKPEVDLGYGVVVRESGADRSKTVVPFKPGAALNGSDPEANIALRARDDVYIFSKYRFRPPLRGVASGEVRQPGLYRIEAGARVADLVRLAGGTTHEALLARAELLRYLPDRSRQTLYVDLESALAGTTQHNLLLEDEDQLVVHSVWDQTFDDAVTVEGEVKRPGEIPLTRGMQVADLVFKAGGLTRDAYAQVAHLYRTDRESKEVTIHTFALGDALRGEPGANLTLQDRDNVVIHSTYQFAPQQMVVVAGKVNNEGNFPYATNMHVRDLVLAAGGLTEEAYLESAEVVRSEVVDGEIVRVRTIPFHLGQAMRGDAAANFPVEPYDKLFVKTIPEWRETRKVALEGEVKFPGVYYIAKGERLSSVLRRAGGFTEEAHLRGAVFTRESSREQQQRRLDELREELQQAVLRASSEESQAALNPEDAVSQQQYLSAMEGLLRKMEAAEATGRVIVAMRPLHKLAGTENDLTLEDGDTLTVPPTPQTVAVVGQVYNPTSILWDPEQRSVEHYLGLTGGPTHNAEIERMYVVRADGTVVSPNSLQASNWWARGIEDMELYPGDSILVPEKIVHVNYMKELRDITQILYQIAVTAGVAVLLF